MRCKSDPKRDKLGIIMHNEGYKVRPPNKYWKEAAIGVVDE